MKHPLSSETLCELESMLEKGAFIETRQLCDRLLVHFPDHPEILFIKAIALQHSNLIDESIVILKNIQEHSPDFLDACSQLAYAYFENVQFALAHETICSILKKTPFDAYCWWLYGLIREHQGLLFGAERAYQAAQELDPESYPILPQLSTERAMECINAAALMLSNNQQAALHCLVWNIVETPTEQQLALLSLTPLEPLFYIDRLQAQLFLFRQNLRRYMLLNEHIPSRMAAELNSYLIDSTQLEA